MCSITKCKLFRMNITKQLTLKKIDICLHFIVAQAIEQSLLTAKITNSLNTRYFKINLIFEK